MRLDGHKSGNAARVGFREIDHAIRCAINPMRTIEHGPRAAKPRAIGGEAMQAGHFVSDVKAVFRVTPDADGTAESAPLQSARFCAAWKQRVSAFAVSK